MKQSDKKILDYEDLQDKRCISSSFDEDFKDKKKKRWKENLRFKSYLRDIASNLNA